MKGISKASPYRFRTVSIQKVRNVAGEEAVRKCLERMGRTDNFHTLLVTNSKVDTAVFVSFNSLLGYIAVKVLQNNEIVFSRFEQNEEELENYDTGWSIPTKAKYLLEAWA